MSFGMLTTGRRRDRRIKDGLKNRMRGTDWDAERRDKDGSDRKRQSECGSSAAQLQGGLSDGRPGALLSGTPMALLTNKRRVTWE